MRALAVVLLLAACAPAAPRVPTGTAAVPLELPEMRLPAGAPQPGPARSNAEMAQDFLDLTFFLESGRPVPRMTRFDGPITVGTRAALPGPLERDLSHLLSRLRSEAGLAITRVTGPGRITVIPVPRATLAQAVPGAACFTVPGVSSWTEYLASQRSPAIDWTGLARRDRAAIFLPSDEAPQEARDCLHEEMAQALGPLNDLWRLPDSVFNDDNMASVLTGFDMLMLRVTYARELSNGMDRATVAARLPAVLARLNPAGAARAATPRTGPPDGWTEAIATALRAGAPGRESAARRAVALTEGLTGPERGLSLLALGRALARSDPGAAATAFARADAAYAASPLTARHRARAAMHLSALMLQSGDAAQVLALTAAAIPVAQQAENAALLATLMALRAEALDRTGRTDEARALRLDSLGWARYGFGSDATVQARLAEIAGLGPR